MPLKNLRRGDGFKNAKVLSTSAKGLVSLAVYLRARGKKLFIAPRVM